MKVLMISGDSKILEEGSVAGARMASYGDACEELNILIPAVGGEKKKIQIAKNVFAQNTISLWKLFSFFKLISLGRKIVSSGNWMVTSQDPFFLGFSAWRIASAHGLKLELQIHTDFLSHYFLSESILNKVRVFLAKFLLPKADKIRVVSERIAQSIARGKFKLKTNPFIFPVFVDIENIKNTEPSFDLHKKYPQFSFIALMVSRLSREKNIFLAIKAMARIVEECPNAGLVIVGSGPEEEKLKLAVSAGKLSRNIIFEPWSEDVISYMKTADVFLNTSNYEGYGLSLAEAAISGSPIVSTDVGLIGSILHPSDGLLVCPVGDSECILSKLRHLISLPKGTKQLSAGADGFLINKENYISSLKESWR